MAEQEATKLHQRAQDALESSPIRVLRDVRVDRDGQALVLSGAWKASIRSNWPRNWCGPSRPAAN